MDKYGESTAVHKKVLIVDDSPAEVRLMQGLLEKEGYWPIALHDPKRVEEIITNERPCVILLDVVMPDRNGFQICRDLKGNAEFNMIPVILVTSKDTASDKYWGQQQGADGYLTKPFTREDLLRAVRRCAKSVRRQGKGVSENFPAQPQHADPETGALRRALAPGR